MPSPIKHILVTGAGGQLGNELKDIAPNFPGYRFLFVTRDELAIDDEDSMSGFFKENTIGCCINCAAYTAVDKAETESERAFSINGEAVGKLAVICKAGNNRFIHISTDYVFDGTSTVPYKEDDAVCPINVYGASKLKGEELALKNDPGATVIRTSWVYSSYGNNFVKTMMRLMKEKESINVVNDQWGCPTYAADLAAVIMKLVEDPSAPSGIFNYCNEGAISWYDFAIAIKELTGSPCQVNPIPGSAYPTPAKRPHYSVLDTTRIRQQLHINIPGWKQSLEKCLGRML